MTAEQQRDLEDNVPHLFTENVPADALAVSRAKQTNKDGWAARFRRAMSAKKNKTTKG